jgi:hypothetical protein
MGGEARAEVLSEQLGMNKTTKKFIKFLLGKCGNCAFRIVCWSQLFEDKGELINAYQKVFLCDGHYKGQSKESFDGKQVVKFITHCAIHDAEGKPCKYLEHCMCKILDSDEFMGMVEATDDDVMKHVEAIKRCANCPDNERCWSEILHGLGFGWASSPKVAWIMAKCKFTGKRKEIDFNE